jgi:hypothetical protein
MLDRIATLMPINHASNTFMSLLTISCFDIAYKCFDADTMINFAILYHYVLHAANEHVILWPDFKKQLRDTELYALTLLDSDVTSVTASEYLLEVTTWYGKPYPLSSITGCRVFSPRVCCDMAVSAFLFFNPSSRYTSFELAAGAGHLAEMLTEGFEVSSRPLDMIKAAFGEGKLNELCSNMASCVDQLLSNPCYKDAGFDRKFSDLEEGSENVMILG